MNSGTRIRSLLGRRLTLVLVAVVALVAVVTLLRGGGERLATAHFTQAKGLYEGDAVQILGVNVGKVTKIQPEPGRVRIEFSYDAAHRVPADVKVALVAPSLVSVRALALAPAYESGPELADGAVVPISRTAVPVEWDDVKRELDKLAVELGPKGVNAKGSLTRLLDTTAANLKGQGSNLNRTLRSLSEAMATLADGRGDLFATVRNLQVFVEALASSDAQVNDFTQRLTNVSRLLANDREELGAALKGTERAFTDMQAFLKENRASLKSTVSDMEQVVNILARNRQQLADTLQFAPHTYSNFYAMFDPRSGGVTGALAADSNLDDVATIICSSIAAVAESTTQASAACEQALKPLADVYKTLAPPGALPYLGSDPLNPTGGDQSGGAAGSLGGLVPDLSGLLLPGGTR